MVVSHVPVSFARSIRRLVELGEDSLIGRLPHLLGPSALEACMAPVPVGLQRRPLPQGAHQEASAGLGGCEAAGGRLGWVRKAQAGLADRDGRQLALAFRLSHLQQGRQEDRANGFLDRLERRPAVRDEALQVLPLLLEGLGKAGVGGLGVPSGHLRERLGALDPLGNLGLEPLGEGRLGAKEVADVATTVDKLEAEGFESLLGPRPIFRVAYKYAFGRLGEVAPFRPQALEVEHSRGHPRRAPLELPVVGKKRTRLHNEIPVPV
jgi:hypothetical protein